MTSEHQIEHKGVVETSVSGKVRVRILSQSACASCHAKSACTAADQQEKIIDVVSDQNYAAGENVLLTGEKSMGLKAAWWAYILPVFLVIGTLIVSFALTANEGLSGVLALAIMVPYFLIIRFLNDKFIKTFTFTIKPSTHSAI